MKSVVLVSYSFGIGGVEKALLGVVNKFVKEEWDVHIALIKPMGEFLEYLPTGVSIHHIHCFEQVRSLIHSPMRQTIIESLRNGKLLKSLIVGFCLIDSKFRGGARLLYNYAFKKIPSFSDRTFDLAIAFAGPDAFIDTYVQKCIKAKEKWGWIHFDISKFGIDRSIISDVYKEYSCINVVSIQAKEIFEQSFPQFSNKTKFTPNIVDVPVIEKMAGEEVLFPQTNKKHIILTVGRISKEKGQFKALQALDALVKQGFDDLQWWFVGDGTDMERCRQYVHEANIDEYVRFIGATANPYPYMKRCDLYVQPSEHEGFCITLAEAKIFEMPIVATDFTGANEQLISYSKPYKVVEHCSSEIAEAIKSCLLSC